MRTVTILALDLGLKTGWALHVDGQVRSGVEEFKTGRHTGAGMQFIHFRGFLDRLHRDVPVGRIVYEEVRRHLGVDAAHTYGGFWAHLTAWCQEHQVPFEGVPVATIKKYATGKGNAKKPDMVAAVQRRYPTVTDDNTADAIALLHYVRGEPL